MKKTFLANLEHFLSTKEDHHGAMTIRALRKTSSIILSVNYTLRNMFDSSPIVDRQNDDIVVSLTTNGKRISSVYLTIESIANGSRKPSRLILWLNDKDSVDRPHPSLERLVRRGLELKYAQNYGPHTKYFPYISSTQDHTIPLVTADDDIFYPSNWLRSLEQEYIRSDRYILCHRAKRIKLGANGCLEYDNWPLVSDSLPAFTCFATGVSGVLYPPNALNAIAKFDTKFQQKALWADDIWLHYVAINSRILVKQLCSSSKHYLDVPGTRSDGLAHKNVSDGRNDKIIESLYGETELEKLLLDEESTVQPF